MDVRCITGSEFLTLRRLSHKPGQVTRAANGPPPLLRPQMTESGLDLAFDGRVALELRNHQTITFEVGSSESRQPVSRSHSRERPCPQLLQVRIF